MDQKLRATVGLLWLHVNEISRDPVFRLLGIANSNLITTKASNFAIFAAQYCRCRHTTHGCMRAHFDAAPWDSGATVLKVFYKHGPTNLCQPTLAVVIIKGRIHADQPQRCLAQGSLPTRFLWDFKQKKSKPTEENNYQKKQKKKNWINWLGDLIMQIMLEFCFLLGAKKLSSKMYFLTIFFDKF